MEWSQENWQQSHEKWIGTNPFKEQNKPEIGRGEEKDAGGDEGGQKQSKNCAES